MTISTAAPDYLLHNADLPTPGVRKDYHRFYLDPHTLPSPRIVGVLACQRDPYLRSLETRVVAVQKAGEEALARSRGVTAQMANAQPGKEKEKGKGGKGKGGKGNSDKAVSNGNKDKDEPELWQVEIEDTVLFPEGGGQPNDTGILHLPTDGGKPITFVIQDVFRRGLTALHVVRLAEANVGSDSVERDFARRALEEVKTGAECMVTVDWERRYDQMTQHTAQHLLSAICDTHLALPTLSWFMPPHPSTEPCYIELPRSLTPSEASAMEDICNSLVTRRWGAQGEGEEVKVWIESRLQKRGGGGGGDKALASAIAGLSVGNGGGEETKMTDQVEVEEAQGLGMLSNLKPGGFAVHDEEEREWADRESRGLPRDYAGGVIRTAVIDGIDRNPTDVNRSLAPNSLLRNTASPASDDDHHDSHLILPPSSFLLHSHPTLSKIGLIHVLPPTTVSQKPTRLYMVAGHRATRHLIAASAELTRASVAVGCSRDQLAARAEQREQGRREMVRWQERMRQELAKALGVAVVWRPTMTTHEGAGTAGEIQCAVVSRAEEATHDFEFLSALNVAAVDALKTTAEAEVESAATTGHLISEGLPRYALAVHSTVVPMANNGITEAGSLVLITTNPPDLAREYGDKLKAALDVIPGQEKGRCKGGGAKGRWMGKVSGKWSRADAVALEKLLSA